MSVVAETRTVVVVGIRPRQSAAEILGDLRPGDEAAIFVLGLDPSPRQRRLTDEALALAVERRFVLTAELIPAPSWLRDRLQQGDQVRVIAGRREARRWRVGPGTGLNGSGA